MAFYHSGLKKTRLLLPNHYIAGLQVTMHDVHRVQVLNREHQFRQVDLHDPLIEDRVQT